MNKEIVTEQCSARGAAQFPTKYEGYIENGYFKVFLEGECAAHNVLVTYQLLKDGNIIKTKQQSPAYTAFFELEEFGKHFVVITIYYPPAYTDYYHFRTPMLEYSEMSGLLALNPQQEGYQIGLLNLHHLQYIKSSLASELDNFIANVNELLLAGYTIPEYLHDIGIKKIYLYTEQAHWKLASMVFAQFSISNFLEVQGRFSDIPFHGKYNLGMLPECTTQSVSNVLANLGKDDVVLLVTARYNNECIKRLFETGARIIGLNTIINPMRIRISVNRPILDFMRKNPKVRVFVHNIPYFPVENYSENEKKIKENNIIREDIVSGLKKKPPTLLSNVFDTLDTDEILEILEPPPRYTAQNGAYLIHDIYGKHLNVVGGHRLTTDHPHECENTVYMFGSCIIFGTGASDEGTIASNLQRLINTNIERSFNVQNYGNFLADETFLIYNTMNSIKYKDGDIVIIEALFEEVNELLFCDTTKLFQQPHEYGEVFYDINHYIARGYHVIAEHLFKSMQQHNIFEQTNVENANDVEIPKETRAPIAADLSAQDNIDLAKYKDFLLHHQKIGTGKVGSIVMNCNPFTLGHRYLIEYAASRVEQLYIFIVQEDRSIFPFDDRIELVKQGTQDLANVTVLPSGKFIISSLTFTDYFGKQEMTDRIVDSSTDVLMFAQEIAPTLNISVRFVGEEPLCNVTRQYNDTMKMILPQHGIEIVIIPRKESGGEPISASRVRKLLDSKDFNAISKIVPPSTLDYLRVKFETT